MVFFVIRFVIRSVAQAKKDAFEQDLESQRLEAQWLEEDKDSMPTPPPSAAPRKSHKMPPVTKGYVLVADSSKTIRQAVRMLLQTEGYGILEAETGSEAWKILKKGQPGLVIAYTKLSTMNGYQLAEKALSDSDTRDIPMILTRGGGPQGRDVSKLENVRSVISRPFESQELMEAVEQTFSAVAEIPVCPVCEITVDGEYTTCPACGAIHHPECFVLNDGCGRCGYKT